MQNNQPPMRVPTAQQAQYRGAHPGGPPHPIPIQQQQQHYSMPYHQPQQYNMQSQQSGVFSNCVNVCGPDGGNVNAYTGYNDAFANAQRMQIRLQGDQPSVPVPVQQDIYRRDKFIEVPQVELRDTVIPKMYDQAASHQIPTVDLKYTTSRADLTVYKNVDKPIEKNVSMGYYPKFEPTWDVREIPRPVPKYIGQQEVIEVEVPKIEYSDTIHEKEIVVDVKEKIVPKYQQVEKEVEVVQYHWREEAQDVPVYKYVPKFDVELDCPPPLIVPYPQTQVIKDQHVVLSDSSLFCGIPNCYEPNAQPSGITPEEYLHGHAREVPQEDHYAALHQSLQYGNQQEKHQPQEQSAWNLWGLLGSNEPEPQQETYQDEQGIYYPATMPRDFASHFQTPAVYNAESSVVDGSEGNASEQLEYSSTNEADVLEPSVQYKGAINKAAEYGGELDPISFRLHAIEVHQFISVPNLDTPEFVKALPEGSANMQSGGLEKLFGVAPSGWADSNVTGVPAVCINQIMEKKAHASNMPSQLHTHQEVSNDATPSNQEPQALLEARQQD